MTRGRAWYVKGQKLAFPHGERLCSGPFDESADAFTEAKRIRPFYPDANLSVVLHVAKSLPERTPRSGPPGAVEVVEFDLRNVTGRRAAGAAIAARAEALGVACVVEDWDGEPDVSVTVPGLRAHIWLAYMKAAPMPIVSWVAQGGRKLRPVLPGAWRGEGFPHYKATSLPNDWPALFVALETGILAGIDGTAFASEE